MTIVSTPKGIQITILTVAPIRGGDGQLTLHKETCGGSLWAWLEDFMLRTIENAHPQIRALAPDAEYLAYYRLQTVQIGNTRVQFTYSGDHYDAAAVVDKTSRRHRALSQPRIQLHSSAVDSRN